MEDDERALTAYQLLASTEAEHDKQRDEIGLKERGMKSFQVWCEDRGRRWMGAATYEEFEKNAQDYEAYRKVEADREEMENKQRRMS